MKNLTVSRGRRSLLIAGLAMIAAVAALVSWAQDNSFANPNSLGQDANTIKPSTPAPTQYPSAAPTTTGNATTGLKQVEMAATSLQIVAITGGVGFWDPVKRLLYIYPADFSTCSGVYQMGVPGQPMQRVGP